MRESTEMHRVLDLLEDASGRLEAISRGTGDPQAKQVLGDCRLRLETICQALAEGPARRDPAEGMPAQRSVGSEKKRRIGEWTY